LIYRYLNTGGYVQYVYSRKVVRLAAAVGMQTEARMSGRRSDCWVDSSENDKKKN
jgi:hypothetical protein